MKLDAISIVTADMAAAVRFYSALGLDLSSGGADAPHTEFDSGSLRVLLDTEDVMRSIDPEWVRATGGQAMSLAFDCGTAEAVDAAFAELTGVSAAAGADGSSAATADTSPETPAAGVEREPWNAFWGQRYAVITDPDGNTVDLFAALD